MNWLRRFPNNWALGATILLALGAAALGGTLTAALILTALGTFAGIDFDMQLWLLISAAIWLPAVIGAVWPDMQHFGKHRPGSDPSRA